jgi:hypothetical protein
MAVHKATRSNPLVQPEHPRPNHQLKADIFEVLRHLNRGYGVALAALDKLETKARSQTTHTSRIFPSGYLRDYRDRTEALRSLANRDLLRLFAEHEERDATRFTKETPSPQPRNSRA